MAESDWAKRVLVSAATAVAVFVFLYFPDRNDGSGAVLGALAALIAVPLGLTALAKYRTVSQRSVGGHLRLVPLALGLGAALGIANLLVNYGMAVLRPAIYEQMVTRWAKFSPWSVVVAGPIIEEIAYRLVLLSFLAWLIARFTDNHRTIFCAALGLSSALFGVAHIFYGGVDDPIYVVGMAVKSSAAGLLLGWVFWRWGIAYSTLCHCAANGIHLLLMPLLFEIPRV